MIERPWRSSLEIALNGRAGKWVHLLRLVGVGLIAGVPAGVLVGFLSRGLTAPGWIAPLAAGIGAGIATAMASRRP